MAAQQGRARQQIAVTTTTTTTNKDRNKTLAKKKDETNLKEELLVAHHLPPLFLVWTIVLCSGFLFVLGMRDFSATGKNIAGSWDEDFLIFTKSTDWFDDSKGWRSTLGGFSAVRQVTTDENNMGGFFVRKMAGAATLTVHLQKILPFLFHPNGAQWGKGHFKPLLWTGLLGNIAILAFWGLAWEDLNAANVVELPIAIMTALAVESLVILGYLLFLRSSRKTVAVAMPEGKTPSSRVSNVVARTVMVVSSMMAVIAGRDLFFPGQIIELLPRDDIYLEWTNAFFHSPPEGSPESNEQGLEAPLFVGDKFVSQLMALHLLILCLYKFVSSLLVRYGNDASGEIQARMIWKVQAVGDAMILFLLRIFTQAAQSASLDLRYHLMCVGYETFVLGLYGFA